MANNDVHTSPSLQSGDVQAQRESDTSVTPVSPHGGCMRASFCCPVGNFGFWDHCRSVFLSQSKKAQCSHSNIDDPILHVIKSKPGSASITVSTRVRSIIKPGIRVTLYV